MKTTRWLAALLLTLASANAHAQTLTVEGCATVGGTCEYDATTSGSIAAQGTWKVEIWWDTTCAAKAGDPQWTVASAGGSPSHPGDGNNAAGVAGYWDGSISGEFSTSCAQATALTPTSSVVIGNFPSLPQP